MSLGRNKQEWEDLAATDPLWAILSDPGKRGGRWELDEFFGTGEPEIAALLEVTGTLGYPRQHHLALDFGCGVGRLSRALASHFDECYGVDISDHMIQQARALNPLPNCVFMVNDSADLAQFQDDFFDLIYCNIVLQHLPAPVVIERYIGEFLRVLNPDGMLVFQLPYLIPWRNRLQFRRRAYAVLRGLGCRERFLMQQVGLNPIRMTALSEQTVRRLIERGGGVIAHVEPDSPPESSIQGLRYYVHLETANT